MMNDCTFASLMSVRRTFALEAQLAPPYPDDVQDTRMV